MSLHDSIMRRLSFIYYLKNKADDDASRPSPGPSVSVLTLHDSIELYLYVASEHLAASKPTGIDFMGYWERISEKLPEDEKLSHKASMERLNRARKNLKHGGVRPHEADVNTFRVAVDEFFHQNTPVIFGIDFEDISLVNLIEFEGTKEYLEKSETYKNSGNYKESLLHSAYAFESLLLELKSYSRDELGYTPLISNISHRSRHYSSGYTHSKSKIWLSNYDEDVAQNLAYLSGKIDELGDAVGSTGEEIENISRDLDRLERDVEVLSLGIDYMEFSRFNHFTPKVIVTRNGREIVENESKEKFHKLEEADFCHNFALDATLRTQDLVLRRE